MVLLSIGWAQSGYLGGSASFITGIGADATSLLGVQVGVLLNPHLALRGTVERGPEFGVVGVDILSLSPIPDTTASFYFGGGFSGFLGGLVIPSVHGTLGAEYRWEPVGIYAEVQPQVLFLLLGSPSIKARTGVNLYF